MAGKRKPEDTLVESKPKEAKTEGIVLSPHGYPLLLACINAYVHTYSYCRSAWNSGNSGHKPHRRTWYEEWDNCDGCNQGTRVGNTVKKLIIRWAEDSPEDFTMAFWATCSASVCARSISSEFLDHCVVIDNTPLADKRRDPAISMLNPYQLYVCENCTSTLEGQFHDQDMVGLVGTYLDAVSPLILLFRDHTSFSSDLIDLINEYLCLDPRKAKRPDRPIFHGLGASLERT